MKRTNAQLRTVDTDRIVVPQLEVADSLWTQTVGLMGRKGLPLDGGMLIPNCNAIHTAFVRFPIDVLFLDRDLTVVRAISALAPWRIVGFVRGAKSVVELPAGTLRHNRIEVGQRFAVDIFTSPGAGERA